MSIENLFEEGLGFKNEYGFIRKEKRFNLGLKRGKKKKGNRIFPKYANNLYEQYHKREKKREEKGRKEQTKANMTQCPTHSIF